MIDSIAHALMAVRVSIDRPIVVTKTYKGKAYKKEQPEGIIGFKTSSIFVNTLGTTDETNYYILHRRSFWKGWAEHCGLRYNPSQPDGMTISLEIYQDMKEDKSCKPQLLVTSPNRIYFFNINEVVKYVESHKTLVKNQNHGFMEVGIPIAIHHYTIDGRFEFNQ